MLSQPTGRHSKGYAKLILGVGCCGGPLDSVLAVYDAFGSGHACLFWFCGSGGYLLTWPLRTGLKLVNRKI
eukprot:4835581-Pleurochrysis_carterae.AAC.1